MTTDLIPLVGVGHALMERYGVPSPGYQRMHRLISTGLLKPERIGDRLFFKSTDLPAIAAALGIAVPAKEATKARRAPRAA